MNWQEQLQTAIGSEELVALALSLGTRILVVAFLLVLARVLLQFGYALTDRLLSPPSENGYIEERKAQTLRGLVKSILRYIVYFVAAVTVLDTLGIGVTSVLAGAGIVGLAVGFGAQNLVRDIITGFFIIFEDQYAIGEYVSVGDASGIVEELGLRVTKIRAFAGDLHIVPNGNIGQVTNFSRGNMRALVDIRIAYEENIQEAMQVLEEVSHQIAQEIPEIMEGPTVLGVVDLGDSEVVIRVIAQTQAMHQWAVERQLRKRFKEVFDERGIEIPYPRRVVISRGTDPATGIEPVPEQGFGQHHADEEVYWDA